MLWLKLHGGENKRGETEGLLGCVRYALEEHQRAVESQAFGDGGRTTVPNSAVAQAGGGGQG